MNHDAKVSFCKMAAVKTAVCMLGMAITAATIGCGLGGNTSAGSGAASASPSTSSKVKHDGSVHGGQQPITGADIKLYAAGTTGYGQGSSSLMTNTVTTDANGFFTLTGNYSCTPGQLVYLVAKNGTEINTTNAVSISAFDIVSNVAYFQAANSLAAGQTIALSGFTTGTYFNGQNVTVLATGLSSTQFEATFTNANAGTATAPITAYAITSNVATFTSSNTLSAGQTVVLSGFPTSTFLNNQTLTVVSATSTSFTVNFTHANVTTATEAGTATVPIIDAGTASPTTLGSNSTITLMASLGTCPSAGNFNTAGNGAISYINANELTTAATVWALQQFMAAPAAGNVGAPAIGAPSTHYCNTGSGTANPSSTTSCNAVTGVTPVLLQPGLTGLSNAFKMATILTDITQGSIPNTNYAYATPETAKLTTIGNILASCVNSAGGGAPGGVTDGTICGNLFSYVTPSGSTAAADTTQAAWYMAQNPVLNVSSAYGLVTGAGAAFSGGLTSAPKDWTVAVNFAPTYGSGTFAVDEPYGLAIDAYGNAWISNAGGIAGSALVGVAELGADGSAIITPANTFTASTTGGTYSLFTTPPASNTVTFSAPKIVSIDLNNNAWIPNSGSTAGTPSASAMAEFTGSTGVVTGGTGSVTPTSTGYWIGSTPWGTAVDANNNVFVTNTGSQSATVMAGRSMGELNASTGAFSFSTSTSISGIAANTTGTLATNPYGMPGGQALIAIDANPNVTGGIVWGVVYNTLKVVGQFNATTPFGLINLYGDSTLLPLNATSGGLSANYINSTSEAGSSLSSANLGACTSATTAGGCGSTTPFVGQLFTAGMANPYGIAVDKSNGVWISDVYTSSVGFDGLTYIGAASSTGAISSSYYLANGVLPTSSVAGTAGTTMTKAAADIVDGNNNVWVVSQTAKSFAEATLCTSTSPSACSAYSGTPFIAFLTPNATQAGNTYGLGFVHTMATPIQVGIDPSGNVWSSNNGTGTYTNQAGLTTANIGNTVTVLVGAAGPVVTPLSVAIANNHIAQKP